MADSIPARRSLPRLVVVLAWVVLAGGVLQSVRSAWISDDIYVTFRTCDNVLAGHGPVYNPGERSEGYTHFLWFAILTVGRALAIPAVVLGKYAGIPAFAASLILLARISARWFPRTHGRWVLPVAALAWAWHPDARLFASGGLETATFVFFLLLAFHFLAVSDRRRRLDLAAWAMGAAALTRPDGLLHAVVATAWVAAFVRPRAAVRFALLVVLLVAPLFVFRLAYYGYPFPNPYYAKSGGAAYWSQGLWYFVSYFRAYPVLLLGILVGAVVAIRAWRHRRGPQAAGSAEAVPTREAGLALAFAWSAAHLLAVTRLGGDFMFARFYLPDTPFLLLLCEAAIQRLRRPPLRTAAALALVASIVAGAWIKATRLSNWRADHGIVDEPSFYPDWKLEENRLIADALRPCLEGTEAQVLVVAGQLSLAYYARFPVAVELYGLTDSQVAHAPLRQRGRPGHEKFAAAQYVYNRGVQLRIRTFRPVRLPPYAVFTVPTPKGTLYGEIIVYDRPFMEALRTRCPQIRFLDFPRWLEAVYLPRAPQEGIRRLVNDYNVFKRFYFDHNPDPEGLQDRLRAILHQRGIDPIPVIPPPPGQFREATHLDRVR